MCQVLRCIPRIRATTYPGDSAVEEVSVYPPRVILLPRERPRGLSVLWLVNLIFAKTFATNLERFHLTTLNTTIRFFETIHDTGMSRK